MAEILLEKQDARFTEVEGGLIVKQAGEQYLARGWRLTPELIGTVEAFFEHGCPHLIRLNHPMPENRTKGVDYLGFSRSPTEMWVAVIDQYSGRPSIDRVTVQKRFRDILIGAKFPFAWETSGGKNIFIERRDLPDLLALLTPEIIAEAETRRKRRNGTARALARSPMIVSEDELQEKLAGELREKRFSEIFGEVAKVIEHPRWGRRMLGPRPQTTDIPDVILFTDKTMLILELKLNEVDTQALHQVANYAANDEAARLAEGRKIQAVVIGHRLNPEVGRAENRQINGVSIPIFLYSLSGDGHLMLTQV